MNDKLVVYEEETRLLWGLVVLVTTSLATILLGDAFLQNTLFRPGLQQVAVLILFSISFLGVVRISEPLYRFELAVTGYRLQIDVFKGDEKAARLEYPLDQIDELVFVPRTPPGENEALIDFTANYHIAFRTRNSPVYRRLIQLEGVSFTLKIEDIGKIMRFIIRHKPEISVDNQQARYLDL